MNALLRFTAFVLIGTEMSKTTPLIVCLAWLCACAATPENSSPSPTGSPALHAVQDQELRGLMDRMNALMMERFMTEHEMDIERRRHADQIIEAAKSLAATAKILEQKLPGLGLNPDEQKAFRTLAEKLGQDAKTLQNQAENHAYSAISGKLHDMQSTCLACHTLFRKL